MKINFTMDCVSATLLSFAMMVATLGSAEAQEIKVRSINPLTTDITARSAARMDANNKECAIVRVNIPVLKTMEFGNVTVGKPEYNAGEYLLYVPEGTQQIPVSVDGYKSGVIDFADYGIDVESKQVYRATLYIDKGVHATSAKYGSVKLTTEPTSSRVLMDGYPIGETPLTLKDVPVGKHVFAFPNMSGYTLADQTIEVKENTTIEKHYKLKEANEVFEFLDNIPLGGSFNDGGTTYPLKYKQKTVKGKRGVMDYWDNWVVPPTFDYVDEKGIAVDGGVIFKVGYGEEDEYQVGLYKPGKGLILPCDYSNINANNKGLINVWKGTVGFVSPKGKELVPCIYSDYKYCGDGVYALELKTKDERGRETTKYGLMDDKGKMICSPKYDRIYSFAEGIGFAEIDNQKYVINNKGEIVKQLLLPPNCNIMSNYNGEGYTEGLLCVGEYRSYGVVNLLGKQLLPIEFDDIENARNGWVILYNRRNGDRAAAIDKNGHTYQADDRHGMEIVGRYLILPIEDEKENLIDQNGNVVLANQDEITRICYMGNSDEYISAKSDDRLTVYDSSLNKLFTIDDAEALNVMAIKDGIALLWDLESGAVGYANLQGEILANCLFNWGQTENLYPNGFVPELLILHGLAQLCIGDRCGFVDKDGNIVIPLIYSAIVPFYDGTAYGLKPDGTWVDLKLEELDKKQ